MASYRSHSAHGAQKVQHRYVKRDPVASRRHGESTQDIDRACKIWLLENCPGYRAESEARNRTNVLRFGKRA